jgi:uncharacterized protein (PEP-CTERM system associated)
MNGTVEAIENFFFVDPSVNATQQPISPFGSRPLTLSTASNNRYTAQTHTVSPYIRGLLPDNMDYEMRNNSTWTRGNAGVPGADSAYTNQILGHITRRPTPVGWAVEIDRTDLEFQGQSQQDTQGRRTQVIEHARTRATYLFDPTLEVFGTVGYEDNRIGEASESGIIYGPGLRWRPTDRTNVSASWEHRFFGTAYALAFDHRMPHIVWSIHATRDI